jgi:hypothetical protein
MAPDGELVLIFASLHLAAVVLGGVLFAMFLRSGTSGDGHGHDDEEDEGGGGNDRVGQPPKTSPSGGLPLPDAEPAPIRLRGPGRLRDLRPRRERRPIEHPQPAPSRRRVAS